MYWFDTKQIIKSIKLFFFTAGGISYDKSISDQIPSEDSDTLTYIYLVNQALAKLKRGPIPYNHYSYGVVKVKTSPNDCGTNTVGVLVFSSPKFLIRKSPSDKYTILALGPPPENKEDS